MASNTQPKKDRRSVEAPSSEANNDQSRTLVGYRITQLTDLDTELAALSDMTLAQMRAR